MKPTPLLIAGLLAAAPSLAFADDPTTAPAPASEPAPPPEEGIHIQDAAPTIDEAYGEEISVSGSARSYSSQWMVMPRGWEATGELDFITADAPPGGTRTKLTDLVISRASLRKSIKGRAEIGAGVDLLPKQTSFTDDSVWEGANADVKVGFKTKYALDGGLALGPLTTGDGLWTAAGLTVDRRSIVHDTLSFQYGVGAGYTDVNGDMERLTETEVVAHAKTLFQIQDAFGLWFGADMGFPVSHSGKLMDGTRFDPQSRVDVDVGMVYSLVDNWDVYMQAAIVDRGDLAAPATELPILVGGSDQRVVTFGITRHFGEQNDDDDGGYDEMASY